MVRGLIATDVAEVAVAEEFECRSEYGGFPKLGVPFWGPYNKDYSIWGR